MTRTRILTGITPSGSPHLGNYAGAIRPAIDTARQPSVDAFFFLADYHALIKAQDPELVSRSCTEIAAAWLASGLDPEQVTFYRQSDIPEIPELMWILNCLSPKGLMNRAHAYKATVDKNTEQQEEPDHGVSMGLFSYPVLMAADILMFNAQQVPVGRDQIQHVEMTRDLAQRFNHHYGQGRDYFVLPEASIDERVAVLPGLDGRKMSKSYRNTIPLFEGSRKDLKNAVSRIQTDSLEPGQPKEPDGTALHLLYAAFASEEQASELAQQLRDGMAWGDAKEALFKLLDGIIEPMRERYQDLMKRPDDLEDILQAGAKKARALSVPFMADIRHAVGLRAAGRNNMAGAGNAPKKQRARKARFVSFRENDGFRFRLLDADDQELLCSMAFDDPKAAGQLMKQLKDHGAGSMLDSSALQIVQAGRVVAQAVDAGEDAADWRQRLEGALASLREA